MVIDCDAEERSRIIPLRIVHIREEESVSPVIGTILMVAITVVLAAVLWLMVSGMSTTTQEKRTVVTFDTPEAQQQNRLATTCWDVSLDILRISPSESKVLWIELTIAIKSAAGSVLYAQAFPSLDTGVYPNDLTVRIWYIETNPGDTKMSGGDEIKITSMDVYYEGALVELIQKGEIIGSVNLPSTFP
jgi:flagellin-like protein